MQAKSPPTLWSGQGFHLPCLLGLLVLVGLAWDRLDQPLPLAFWTAVAFPIAHQLFVWLAWRLELNSGATSRVIGFGAYLCIFFALFGGRFLSLAALAWLDAGSLGVAPTARIALTALLALPAAYALYSVHRYFGLKRAAGADHFIPSYRDLPLVKDGIFRFTNNGMYCFAFLIFWAIAIGFNSSAALVVVAFSHPYIWVHYFAVEKPDMRFLYSRT